MSKDKFKREFGKQFGYGGPKCHCCRTGRSAAEDRRTARRTMKQSDASEIIEEVLDLWEDED